jgi:hypothetical protein
MTITATTLRELRDQLNKMAEETPDLPVPWDVHFSDNIKDRNGIELQILLEKEMSFVSPMLFEV